MEGKTHGRKGESASKEPSATGEEVVGRAEYRINLGN